MRNAFSQSLISEADRSDFVFLTGDLGYSAFEGLAALLGPRFINAGVAEQNMISVAAGLARSGLRPWAYSIAPFLYSRANEQIRNDVCLHRMPVVLVGNGGGYGYGVMGASHHALEDYGTLLGFPNLQAYIPAFDEDVPIIVRTLFESVNPSYLRLGLSERPAGWSPPAYSQWRKLLDGGGPTLIVVGPLVGGLLAAAGELTEQIRPRIWLLSKLPCEVLPDELLADVRQSKNVCTVEEHVSWSGAGRMLAELLATYGETPDRFALRAAQGYPSGRYGSQCFHRQECGLDPSSIINDIVYGDA